MVARGHAQVAHVPFLLDGEGKYLDLPNRYLRERALLEWIPSDAHAAAPDAVAAPRALSYPTTVTLRNIGDRVKNFLMWCQQIGLDWQVAEYTKHLILGYQAAMLTGTWSATNEPLEGSTINQRIDEATLLLTWAAQTQLRPRTAKPFLVPSVRNRVKKESASSSRGQATIAKSRAGKANVTPRLLALPSAEQKADWLRRVYILHGQVYGMACELILHTGIRINECVQWEEDYLPLDRGKWNIKNEEVLVLLSAGTKGHKPQPNSIHGPSRWIPLPLSFAEKLDAYRRAERLSQQARWIRAADSQQERAARKSAGTPRRLFLGERTNRPFSTRMLRKIWSGTPGCPTPWSPHIGRHSFACDKLIELTVARTKAAGRAMGELNPDWLVGSLSNDITLVLRPIMGHLSDETTNRYLDWLKLWFQSQTGQGPLRWQDYLDLDGSNG